MLIHKLEFLSLDAGCGRFHDSYDSATYESKTLNAHNAPRRYKPVPPPYYGRPMCPPKQQRDLHKKTLVLDLDETLVHSSFKPVPNADYIIPVEIDNKVRVILVLLGCREIASRLIDVCYFFP